MIAAAALQSFVFFLAFQSVVYEIVFPKSSGASCLTGRQLLCSVKRNVKKGLLAISFQQSCFLPRFPLFCKEDPPPPLIFFVHCSVNYCEWSLQFFLFFPSVFLDDTMQGISGRKVRLEGGETLQSSLVTMRWFSYRSSWITLFFVSWTFSCFFTPPHVFFSPLGSHSPIFDLLCFHIYLWWSTGRVCRWHNTDAFLSCLSMLC